MRSLCECALRGSLVIAAVCIAVQPAGAEVIERLFAVVSGHLIMASDVSALRRLGLVPATESNRQVVEQLVNRALILAEVDRYAPPEPDQTVIAGRLDSVRGRFPNEAAFQAVLAEVGLNEQTIRARIRQDLRIEAYMDQRFVVAPPTDEEIQAVYQADPARFSGATLEAARSAVARTIVDERRAPRIMEWIDSLRRRTRVVILSTL
jgi:hypothetical protein